MAPSDRTCLGCVAFTVLTASPGYSELTPGTDWSMVCGERVWTFDAYEDGVDRFRALLETAQTCRLFRRREERR